MSDTEVGSLAGRRRRLGCLRRAVVSVVAVGVVVSGLATTAAPPASGESATPAATAPAGSGPATPTAGVTTTPAAPTTTTTTLATTTTVANTRTPLTPAPGLSSAPPPAPAAPAVPPTSPGTSSAPAGSPPSASAVDPARLLQLLEESAARRRHLDGSLAAEESKLAQLTEELKGAEAQLVAAQSGEQTAWDRLARTLGELDHRQDDIVRLSTAATRARQQDLFLSGPGGACALAGAPATAWLGPRPLSPSPPSSGAGAPPPAAPPPAVADCGRDGRQPTKPVRALQGAVARRDQLRLDVGRGRDEWGAASASTASAADAAAAKSQAMEAQRQSLVALRQSLAAALQDPKAQTAALAGGRGFDPSPLARADIPPAYLDIYRRAATTCSGLAWTVLAAIGKIESDHGRASGPGVRAGANVAGAMGPMQFLGGTWAAYGADGNGDGVRDVYQPADAASGAARYLCANGGGDPARLPDAIWAYNHADWYVDQVLVQALSYGAGGLEPVSPPVDAATLVANRNVTLSPEARADLLGGAVDRRVVALLGAVAANHRITVSTIKTGHSEFVSGTDRVSNHFYGRAVDIAAVDGAAVTASNDAAIDLALAILTADPAIRPDELGSPWPELAAFRGAFSDADHQDHLHVGWRS